MEALEDKVQIERYPAYKNSGVDWLGEIPGHWNVIRFKYLFQEINERSFKEHEELLSVSQYTGVTKKSDNLQEGELLTNASTLEGYKKVYKGDLVSNIMLAWNGSLGFSPFDGITSPAYSVYRLANDNDKGFFHYLVRSDIYKAEFKRNSSGVIDSRLRLYTDDFYRILSLLPPKNEQTAIAQFLDRKTALIDKAIAIKEKQIELLKERRQILIHKAVTRGLDPNVKMKDSGVENLGAIPSHWNWIKFKYVIRTKARLGWKGLKASEYVDQSNYGFLATPDIKGDDIDFSGAYFITQQRYEESPEIMLQKGDVLLVKDGSTLGIVNIVKQLPFYCTVNSSIAVLRIMDNNLLIPDYLSFFLKSDYSQKVIELKKDGMGVPHLFQSDINNFIAIIPPLNEQKEIVDYIKGIAGKISESISCKEQEIEKLKEYKSTLINNAVTGKIKVC